MDYELQILSSMTVSQFRAFRKALTVLIRAGVDREHAIGMLISASENRRMAQARIIVERRIEKRTAS